MARSALGQQLVAGDAGRREGDADGRADEHLALAASERLLQRLDDAGGDGFGLALEPDVLEEDGELVAAETGGGVGEAQAAPQPLGDRHEQLVAGGVAERCR